MFTIRLDESDRPALRTHFLALAAEDRHLRFGCTVADSSIERYVKRIDFSRDAVFGVNGETRSFEGIAHLAVSETHAKLGLSVLAPSRERGIGTALLSRASVHARNRQIKVLFMTSLSTNHAMMRIADSVGMQVITLDPDNNARMSLRSANTPIIFCEQMDDNIALCDAALRDTLLRRVAVTPVTRQKLGAGKGHASS